MEDEFAFSEPETIEPAPSSPIGEVIGIADDMRAALSHLEDVWFDRIKPVPVPWQTLSLQLGGGFRAGLHMLVGGTGAGKTQFALQVALAATSANMPVSYVALELGRVEIAQRLMSLKAGLPWSKLTKEDAPKLIEASSLLESATFKTIEAPPRLWGAEQLGEVADELKGRVQGAATGLLVIDFLQVASSPKLPLRESIAEVAYAARQAAREHGLAVLVLSSVARNGYNITGGHDLTTPEFVYRHDEGWPQPIENPDALIGLGKECGEIEYAADTLSVIIKTGVKTGDAKAVIIATAKGRATGAGWSVLGFDGFRFDAVDDKETAKHIMAAVKTQIDEANTKTRRGQPNSPIGEDKPKKPNCPPSPFK